MKIGRLSLTLAMNSSACESMVVTTGLNVLMQVIEWAMSSENFILI